MADHDINILYRVVGRRTPAEHGLDVAGLSGGMLEIMREMLLVEIEEMAPTPAPTREDLEILLASENPRVRLLAIRLAGRQG